MRDKSARTDSRTKIAFRTKFRESDVYRESRYAKIGGEAREEGSREESSFKAARDQFIANLAIKLLMERLMRSAIELDHFKSDDRVAPPLFFN